jgi:hypothetical protein
MSIDPSKVQSLSYVPVVSPDSGSLEAQLMREAKKVEVQSQIDTKYDPIVERFVIQQPISLPLINVTLALGLFALTIYYTGRR